MTHKMTRLIACLCLVGLLLAGCNRQEDNGPGAMGSQVWEVPSLTYGVLEAEPLENLSWNSGRCEATSRNLMAETENGYYLVDFGFLYYADKSDLTTWLPVCNQPDCTHNSNWSYGEIDCNAYLQASGLVIKDDRIFFNTRTTTSHAYLYPYEGNGQMLLSMAPDGTDKRFAYAVEEAQYASQGMNTGFLTSHNWVYYREYLDKDGNKVKDLYRTTDAGTQAISMGVLGDTSMGLTGNGDETFYCTGLGTSRYSVFRFVENELVETKVMGLDVDEAYFSGNTARIFRPNGGYYDVDLTTREEVFLAPAQLENSFASILLPNCIIETTLFDSRRYQDTSRQLVLFDGETWRTVELPEELADSVEAYEIPEFSVTSDSIFLNCSKDGITYLYRIPLNSDDLAAELCTGID